MNIYSRVSMCILQLGHLNGMETPSSHGAGFEYIRTGNPTRGAFERAIAAVEGGEFAIAFGEIKIL